MRLPVLISCGICTVSGEIAEVGLPHADTEVSLVIFIQMPMACGPYDMYSLLVPIRALLLFYVNTVCP